MKNKWMAILLAIAGFAIYTFFRKSSADNKDAKEKVLYLESMAMPESLDPNTTDCFYSCMEIFKVYEGLYEYHYLKRPAEIIPNLAESMPEVSEDGLTYVFRIKKGVFFHDSPCFSDGKGRELTADDFVYTIKRTADPRLQSPNYAIIKDRFIGLDEWREKNSENTDVNYDDFVAGVYALDKYTLVLKLKKTWPQLMSVLTTQYFFAVPREAVDFFGKEFGNHPVGTGPFMISEFLPHTNKIIAVKNPKFREKYYPMEASEECKHLLGAAGMRIPFVDRIETSVMIEDQPRWLKLMNKDLDILWFKSIADAETKLPGGKLSKELEDMGICLSIDSRASTSFIILNNTVEPFKSNALIRKAISVAIDRVELSRLISDSTFIPAVGVIPPNMEGCNDGKHPNLCFNLEKAKQFMEEAGYPNGKGLAPITLNISNRQLHKNIAEYLQRSLKNIGIDIVISVCSWAELMNANHKGNFQMTLSGWVADYSDAENFLVLFYGGKQLNLSHGGYNNATYNELYEKATTMKQNIETYNLYRQMDTFLIDNAAVLPMYHENGIFLFQKWVKNFDFFEFKKCDYFQYVDIDNLMKKELKK